MKIQHFESSLRTNNEYETEIYCSHKNLKIMILEKTKDVFCFRQCVITNEFLTKRVMEPNIEFRHGF